MRSAVAERIATEIYDAIHNNVATKTDLRELEQRLDLRSEQLERRIDGVEHRLITRLRAFSVVLFTVLFGALHLWPPH
jgi:hypothetical protein